VSQVVDRLTAKQLQQLDADLSHEQSDEPRTAVAVATASAVGEPADPRRALAVVSLSATVNY
jgi:hypothetical protein